MDVTPIVVDIETCGLPNAADFLDSIPDAVPDESPIEADKRLTDPEKIAADVAKKTAARADANREAQAKVERQREARIEKCALDWNVGRIAAIGWWTEREGVQVRPCEDETREAAALAEFWNESRHRTLVGFNVKGFDLKFMTQRSRYLGVPYPVLDLSKYSRRGIADLFLDLTFGDGTYDQGAMRRTLKAFCKRFGLPVHDDINGAEIPALVAAGQWAQVIAHVTSDVELTVALGQRLGVITQDVPVLAQAASF